MPDSLQLLLSCNAKIHKPYHCRCLSIDVENSDYRLYFRSMYAYLPFRWRLDWSIAAYAKASCLQYAAIQCSRYTLPKNQNKKQHQLYAACTIIIHCCCVMPRQPYGNQCCYSVLSIDEHPNNATQQLCEIALHIRTFIKTRLHFSRIACIFGWIRQQYCSHPHWSMAHCLFLSNASGSGTSCSMKIAWHSFPKYQVYFAGPYLAWELY